MIKVEMVQKVSDNGKKFSKHTYLGTDGILRTVDPQGKGRPPHTRNIDGVTGMLKTVTQYVPTAVAQGERPEPAKTDHVGPKQTVLVYADGSTVVAAGGRPPMSNNGHWLVEVQTWTPAVPVKSDIQEIKIEVQEDPHIAYMYGGVQFRKEDGKRGPPSLVLDGKPLEKIIRYVLSDNAPAQADQGEDISALTLVKTDNLVVGDKVVQKGNNQTGKITRVTSDYYTITYPSGISSNPSRRFHEIFKVV